MKRFLTILLLVNLIIISTGCSLRKNKSNPNGLPPIKNPVMGMGVNLFPYPNMFDDTYYRQIADQQLQYLQQSGVKAVRFQYTIETPERSIYFAQKAHAAGIRVFLVVEDYLGKAGTQEYNHGYTFTQSVIDKMKGYVDYYQLANEISGNAIKSGAFPGVKLSDYDTTKLNQTLDFVSGASQAVTDFDAGIPRVITITGMQTAIIDEVIRRNINFEILGWNWFSDFGTNLDSPTVYGDNGPEPYPFMDKLRSFHKTLWVTELNRREGAAKNTDREQADFFQQVVPLALSKGFTGVFPFVLVEDVVNLPDFGLLKSIKTNDQWQISGPRASYNTYTDLVRSNS